MKNPNIITYPEFCQYPWKLQQMKQYIQYWHRIQNRVSWQDQRKIFLASKVKPNFGPRLHSVKMRLWLSLAIEAVVEAPSPFETLSLLRGRRRTIWGRKFPYIYLIKWLLKCLFWREIKNFLLIAHVVYLLLFVCSFLSNSNDKQNLRLKFSYVF